MQFGIIHMIPDFCIFGTYFRNKIHADFANSILSHLTGIFYKYQSNLISIHFEIAAMMKDF